jgi:AraC-like DNA-binding protein
VVVERALLSGEVTVLIVDPQVVSSEFLQRVSATILRTAVRVVLWTSLSAETIPAILAANKISYAEVVFHDRDDQSTLLRQYLHQRDPLSIRAAVLRRLAPTLRLLSREFAANVLKVLLEPVTGRSIASLLGALKIGRRKFERELRHADLCSANALLHLGRILAAFERISRGKENVEKAATAVGYPGGRDLRTHCSKYVRCVPSDFTAQVSAQDLATRIVRVIIEMPVMNR